MECRPAEDDGVLITNVVLIDSDAVFSLFILIGQLLPAVNVQKPFKYTRLGFHPSIRFAILRTQALVSDVQRFVQSAGRSPPIVYQHAGASVEPGLRRHAEGCFKGRERCLSCLDFIAQLMLHILRSARHLLDDRGSRLGPLPWVSRSRLPMAAVRWNTARRALP